MWLLFLLLSAKKEERSDRDSSLYIYHELLATCAVLFSQFLLCEYFAQEGLSSQGVVNSNRQEREQIHTIVDPKTSTRYLS